MFDSYKIMKLKKWIKIIDEFVWVLPFNTNCLYYILNNTQYLKKDTISLIDNASKSYHQYVYGYWEEIIDWSQICSRTDKYSINLLKNNIDKIDWYHLSGNLNPNAINILKDNIDKVYWDKLSSNPSAISILSENMDKIDYLFISYNKNAIFLLTDNNNNIVDLTWTEIYNKLDILYIKYNINKQKFIESFSFSDNKYVLHLLDENPNEINWNVLCEDDNGNATYIIKKYIDIVPFECLCKNKFMIDYITEHIDKYCNGDIGHDEIYWNNLSCNPSAISLLEKNQDKISYNLFYINPEIFEYDYDVIKERIDIYKKELFGRVLNPLRLMNICNKYNVIFSDLMTDVYLTFSILHHQHI